MSILGFSFLFAEKDNKFQFEGRVLLSKIKLLLVTDLAFEIPNSQNIESEIESRATQMNQKQTYFDQFL